MNIPSQAAVFQPTLLGSVIAFQEGGDGMITDETETEIYIESYHFTGWMSKVDFFDSIGIED